MLQSTGDSATNETLQKVLYVIYTFVDIEIESNLICIILTTVAGQASVNNDRNLRYYEQYGKQCICNESSLQDVL